MTPPLPAITVVTEDGRQLHPAPPRDEAPGVEPLVLTAPTSDFEERGRDYYPTPAWVTEALLESDVPPPVGLIIEPAAGDGAILRVLVAAKRYKQLQAIELREEERGHLIATGADVLIDDWLRASRDLDWMTSVVDKQRFSVVTNPPFSIAIPFATACLSVGACYVALLLPVTCLAGAAASWGPFWAAHPPTALRLVRRRPRFNGNGTDRVGVFWAIWRAGRPVLDMVPV